MIASFARILVFFFYGSGVPRDVHSFPTRRSSDLAGVGSVPGLQSRVLATGLRKLRLAMRSSDTCVVFLNQMRNRDRKSTRLNSSHRCISYAVFCLKKKNTLVVTFPRLIILRSPRP